jgi:6-phosphogluconolactonase
MKNIQVYPDPASLAESAARQFIELAKDAIERKGTFSASLAGGSTPKATYELLASREFASQLDWSKVQIFWGDERCVPPNHPDSNFRMAYEALIKNVPIPGENVHRMPGELKPLEAANKYDTELRTQLGDHPQLDLVQLGMGDDGHTASLFPGTKPISETTMLVAANFVQKLKSWRITLTPVMINQASHIVFIVSGSNKAETLREVIQGAYRPDVYPSQIIHPIAGNLTWLIDEAAGQYLEPNNYRKDNIKKDLWESL